MMNFIGSFFGSFATAGALTRSILQFTTGGKTQVYALVIYVPSGVAIYDTFSNLVSWICIIRSCFNNDSISWKAI